MREWIGHAVVGAVVVAIGRFLEWRWWALLAALVAVAFVLEMVLSRGRRVPGHLGAVPVALDDPLMLAAVDQARQTWGTFLRLYAEHPETTIVKFRLRTKSGDIENVWGDLLELGDDRATVSLRTPPVGETDAHGPQMTIPVADIVDWQIMFPDGTLRGGFTQQATFRIIERDRGRLPRKFAEQLARYRALEASV
jgi:uncharacterized protein YegJ (DUF2314 family)